MWLFPGKAILRSCLIPPKAPYKTKGENLVKVRWHRAIIGFLNLMLAVKTLESDGNRAAALEVNQVVFKDNSCYMLPLYD